MAASHSDRARQAGEQRYRHLFEHMPICIYVVDLTATPPMLLEANRRAQLVFGYTAAELVGMSAAQLMPEDARLAVLSIVQRVEHRVTVFGEEELTWGLKLSLIHI